MDMLALEPDARPKALHFSTYARIFCLRTLYLKTGQLHPFLPALIIFFPTQEWGSALVAVQL